MLVKCCPSFSFAVELVIRDASRILDKTKDTIEVPEWWNPWRNTNEWWHIRESFSFNWQSFFCLVFGIVNCVRTVISVLLFWYCFSWHHTLTWNMNVNERISIKTFRHFIKSCNFDVIETVLKWNEKWLKNTNLFIFSFQWLTMIIFVCKIVILTIQMIPRELNTFSN